VPPTIDAPIALAALLLAVVVIAVLLFGILRLKHRLATANARLETIEAGYDDELRALAVQDELTGLPTRRVFADRLEQAITIADRRASPLAVMFLELAFIARVADDYGRAAGDELVRQATERIRAAIRASDTVARLNGDEFVVMLPEVDGRTETEEVARRIIESVEEPYTVEGFQLRTAASIGIAMRMDGEDSDTVVSRADAAMALATRAGHNHYCVNGREPIAV